MSDDCKHENVKADVIDQTLGVICRDARAVRAERVLRGCMDCGRALGYCWPPQHVSERLWNRACKNEEEAIPCDHDREDACAICGVDMRGAEAMVET